MPADLRSSIQSALAAVAESPLRKAATELFHLLGYKSDRTLPIDSLAQLRELLDPGGSLTESNANVSLWKSVHLLFQLTEENLRTSSGTQGLLFREPDPFDTKIVKSYVFFALDLTPRPDGQPHGRVVLSTITRALNRLVPAPVLVLFRDGQHLSLSIINRRKNLKDGTRDVLTRVSLIRDIHATQPHRAHLDLLQRYAMPSLAAVQGAIRTFADLDDAWQKLLSTQELKDTFYRDLAAWFRWAVGEIKLASLPDHLPDNPKNRDRATQEFTVRLICRTLFAWFLKEMRLVPAELLELYDLADHRRTLTHGAYVPEGNQYYRGILQNVFFQALNRPMDQRRKSGPEAAADRTVTKPELKKLAYLGKNHLPESFDYDLFDRIPYLNGGLFDALPEDNASESIQDGAFRIPNKLFYATTGDGYTIASGTGRRSAARPVEGLNRLLDRYRFTVAENTPLEEDVALDPELLGLVFENLLAEIDPTDEAAAESARKASGSYYTPRRIVDYMVNEALHLHLRTEFEKQGASKDDLQSLSRLCYDPNDEDAHASIADRVVAVLDAVRVLDPACGSGAFPMGMLHRMVELLARVDPDNRRWKERLLARLPAPMRADAEQGMAGKSYNYLRKLGLIQKNLYGLDIQPLAALIAKLRFFLTLVIEQEVHQSDRPHNYGLQSLPNLETNFLCCDSLNELRVGTDLFDTQAIDRYVEARDEFYNARLSREQRSAVSQRIAAMLHDLVPQFSQQALGLPRITDAATARQQNIGNLERWFRFACIPAPFYSTRAFFPEIGDGGFHIVIGNPPYGGTKIPDEVKEALGLGSKDPYGAFIARFLGVRPGPLADGGVLAYIVSDTFMTIKTHRPLREQMLGHRVHKMIRVSGDTFKAVVNCAVILCQRGAAPAEQICQMADLTNVSIHDQYERFLHLLYQTEGTAQMGRRQNVSNQTYALYHYRQSLIATNSNLPFFVASPKLFALMNDTVAPLKHEYIGGKRIPVRTVTLNGNAVRLVKLGSIAEVKVGLQTGDNESYLFQNPDARGSYRSIEEYLRFLLTETDLERIRSDEELRNEVVQKGIAKEDKKSLRYFGGRYIAPYDKGGEADVDEGLMPNYWVPTDYFIDWSEWAVTRMKTLTLRQKFALQGKTGGDDRPTSRFQNYECYFVPGLTWSDVGVYSPTIRLSGSGVFDVKGSRFIVPQTMMKRLLGVVCSKLAKMWIKAIENHSVSTQSENIRELIIPAEVPDALEHQVADVIANQRKQPGYDYASNEQIEIDRLVYAAYGLNDSDIREVEDWYARRYPALAQAQRRKLAAKQGKTEDQIASRQVRHLYCDESRHLPHDREGVMLLGLLNCPAEKTHEHHAALAALWKQHGLPLHFESKWTKVSPGKLDFYRALLEWFLNASDISFHGLVLPDKQQVFSRVPEAKQDDIYYSLYYDLLKNSIEPGNGYRAFLDIKDTRGREKLAELRRWLQMNYPSLPEADRPTLQHVRSHEIRLLQVTDLLLGAVGYARLPQEQRRSPAKQALVTLLEERLGQSLSAGSPPSADKVLIETVDGRLL